jgi:hypothetical protein
MYNAIVVRPNAEKPGHFIGVQGRHRHYAKSVVLKEQMIECHVINDMDDEMQEMATIAENLHRSPLTRNQEGQAIKKRHALYLKRNPGAVNAGLAGGMARKRKAKGEEASAKMADASGGETTEGAGTEEAEAEIKKAGEYGFTTQVAAVLGTSKRTAERKVTLAKKFTDEQLEALDQMQVTQEQREAICKIKDATQKGEVIELIASGKEPEEALKVVMGDEAPVIASAAKAQAAAAKAAELAAANEEVAKLKAAEAAAKEAVKVEREPELSDDEWFERYCGEKAKLLANSTRYKVDALVYRKLMDCRHVFRDKAKGIIEEARSGKANGSFTRIVYRVISISHPKDWTLCDTCGGKGSRPPHEVLRCPKCYGAGYELKLEEPARP